MIFRNTAAIVGMLGWCLGCEKLAAPGTSNHKVVVGTGTASTEAQYQADVAFIQGYLPRCTSSGMLPRVLLTGYGRFLSNTSNASGLVISSLVRGAPYPWTLAPPAGQVDDPASQLSVTSATLNLPLTGAVDVCAMILPVDWGLAPALVIKELDQFAPNFVMMNGIANARQPLWLELGSVNSAQGSVDGSGLLAPPDGSPLIPEAPTGATEPLLLSWNTVAQAVQTFVMYDASVTDGSVAFSDVVQGVAFAGFPRSSNTYLCNNLTYDVSLVMDNPGKSVTLLSPSTVQADGSTGVVLSVASDFSAVPRVFVHWPSDLTGNLLAPAGRVMAGMIDAQLAALRNGPAPVRGDNGMAQITQ